MASSEVFQFSLHCLYEEVDDEITVSVFSWLSALSLSLCALSALRESLRSRLVAGCMSRLSIVCLGFYACELFEQAHGFELVAGLEVGELALTAEMRKSMMRSPPAGLFEFFCLKTLRVGGGWSVVLSFQLWVLSSRFRLASPLPDRN